MCTSECYIIHVLSLDVVLTMQWFIKCVNNKNEI